MKNWYSFWVPDFSKHRYINPKQDTLYTNETTFSTRYNEIFGLDPSIGTMSAPNMNIAIMGELNKNVDGLTDVEKNDYMAFIVLAIFRSMNLDITDVEKNPFNINGITNTRSVKGWLTKLYTMHKTCGYKDSFKNLYLFSHGVITPLINSFFQNEFICPNS